MDTRGIYWWAAMNKFRVTINRNRVVYKLGYYDTMEEALKVKQDFLEQYELDKDSSDTVPMYSKEWFKRERQKQVESFSSTYGSGHKDKPKQVTVIDRWWQSPSVESLLIKQQIQNDHE